MFDKTIAFIPVRGGSKSIPYKNIKMLCGKPLVIWVIEAAIAANGVHEVVVSTDSDRIEQVIFDYFDRNGGSGIDKLRIFRRSAENASDQATTESAMLEYATKNEFVTIVLIQATSPLLTTEDIERGLMKYRDDRFDSVLSLVRQKRFIWDTYKDSCAVNPVNYRIDQRPRRQDQTGFLVENGALYITSRRQLLSTGQRISGNIGYIEMSEESYFELDEPSDWFIIEGLLRQRQKNQQKIKRDIVEKSKKIKMFAMDCDGVLTDAGMYYSESGDELKKFNTRDGMGIDMLHKKGIKTAIITGENTQIVKQRAEKLKITEVHLGVNNKVDIMQKICDRYGYDFSEIAYIGDDLNDLELLERVGLSFTVADGHEKLKEIVDFQTTCVGGHGAVREAIEVVLSHRE